MKARLLRKILNDTKYTISNHGKYISVGSPLCHDLISVDKETLKVTYALDTFNDGRKCFEETNRQSEKTELLFIWDKLHELIENGDIQDIINGRDVIENPYPVYHVEKGRLIESCTDNPVLEYPNIDDDGVIMGDGRFFSTKEQAIKYGIEDYKYSASIMEERIAHEKREIAILEERQKKYGDYVEYLEYLLSIENKKAKNEEL